MKKLIMLMLLGFCSGPLTAAANMPGPLVDGEWLAGNREAVLLLDVRKEIASFGDGHIPGAVLVDVNKIRIEREIGGKMLSRMRPDPDSFERFMRSHGVDDDSLVVLTHPGDTPGQVAGAARLYWQMKYYGFEQVALLDGGNHAWVEVLEDLVTETTLVAAGGYRVGDEQLQLLATMQQVRQALTDENATLIDTRDFRYHIGLDKKPYVFSRGHIPGSRSLPYKYLSSNKLGLRYLDQQAYVDILDSLRIDMQGNLILYCNSAYEASSSWFVLHEILGKTDVRVYDGSLHQWTQYDSNPMTARLSD